MRGMNGFSDVWDPMEYGKDYDASRPFFEQFAELQERIPVPHQTGINNVNSDWSDDVWNSKNCYLSRAILDSEDISYGYRCFDCKNIIDCAFCFNSENCYDCLLCYNCYNVRYSLNSRDCIESQFLYDCRNVQNSFMCWNLRNKQYHILNRPYSKEEYREKIKTFRTRSYSGIQELKKQFGKLIAKEAIHRANFNYRVLNSEGNFLDECKNCHECYFIDHSENSRYIFRGKDLKECIDCVGTLGEKTALSIGVWTYHAIGCSFATRCRFSYYCSLCEDCEYCFGCVGLRKKKYCILNKQYDKETYERLYAQIKENMRKLGEWGVFFPFSASLFGYNWSTAHIFFPTSQREIERLGGFWEEEKQTVYSDAVLPDVLPDAIDDVDDAVTSRRILCPETKLSYNIAPHELQFYRYYGIPLPRRHFDFRTIERLKPITNMEKHRGVCFSCKKEIFHYYLPELQYQKIACVPCYQQLVA